MRNLLVVFLLAVFLPGCAEPEPYALLISKHVTIGTAWNEIRPSGGLMTRRPWTEVLIEVPGMDWSGDGSSLRFKDGTSAELQVRLVETDGTEMPLSLSAMGFGSRTFATASNAQLQWTTAIHTFAGVRLRASRATDVARIIWMSSDPRDYKAGVTRPPERLLKN